MVRNGSFSAELVNAETMKLFKEHLKPETSSVYVEMEPHCEYWVRVTCDLPEDQRCKFRLQVDEKNLDRAWTLYGGSHRYTGDWSQSGTTTTEVAFRVKSLDGNNGDNSPFHVGKVKVHFYEAISTGVHYYTPKTIKSSWEGGCHPPACVDGEKALVSSLGTITKTGDEQPGMRNYYRTGRLLQTITLNYCTALGLIHAGVLPKPPLTWNYQRQRFPSNIASIPTWANIQPDMVTATTYADSNVVSVKYCEEFDLTHLEDDNDETQDDVSPPTAATAATAATVSDESSIGSPSNSPQKPAASSHHLSHHGQSDVGDDSKKPSALTLEQGGEDQNGGTNDDAGCALLSRRRYKRKARHLQKDSAGKNRRRAAVRWGARKR